MKKSNFEVNLFWEGQYKQVGTFIANVLENQRT